MVNIGLRSPLTEDKANGQIWLRCRAERADELDVVADSGGPRKLPQTVLIKKSFDAMWLAHRNIADLCYRRLFP